MDRAGTPATTPNGVSTANSLAHSNAVSKCETSVDPQSVHRRDRGTRRTRGSMRRQQMHVTAALLASTIAAGCGSATTLPEVAPDPLVAVIDDGVPSIDWYDGSVVNRITINPQGRPGEHASLVLSAFAQELSAHGTAPRIISLDVVGEGGMAEGNDIAAAIDRALDMEASLVMIALSQDQPLGALEAAVKRAEQRGVPVLAACANDVTEHRSFPADYPHALGITSLESDGTPSPLATRTSADIAIRLPTVQGKPSDPSGRPISGTSIATGIAAARHLRCPQEFGAAATRPVEVSC